jgi:hypothetical protein
MIRKLHLNVAPNFSLNMSMVLNRREIAKRKRYMIGVISGAILCLILIIVGVCVAVIRINSEQDED